MIFAVFARTIILRKDANNNPKIAKDIIVNENELSYQLIGLVIEIHIVNNV